MCQIALGRSIGAHEREICVDSYVPKVFSIDSIQLGTLAIFIRTKEEKKRERQTAK